MEKYLIQETTTVIEWKKPSLSKTVYIEEDIDSLEEAQDKIEKYYPRATKTAYPTLYLSPVLYGNANILIRKYIVKTN